MGAVAGARGHTPTHTHTHTRTEDVEREAHGGAIAWGDMTAEEIEEQRALAQVGAQLFYQS